MDRRDEIALGLIESTPGGKPLAELIHGGNELTLKTLNDLIDLVPADNVTAGSLVIEAFAIITEACDMDSTPAVVTIYEDAGSPVSLGTITFADNDPVGDIRLRAALTDGAAANPAAGNKKYYAKVTTAGVHSGAEAGKAKIYLRWIQA